MNSKTKLLLGLVVLVALAALAWWAVRPGPGDARPETVVAPDSTVPEDDDSARRRRVEPDAPGETAEDEAAVDEEADVEALLPDLPFVRVVDGPGDDASPIAGATVRIASSSGWGAEGRTDERGIVTIPPQIVGEVTVFASAPGHGTRRQPLGAGVGVETRIVLAPVPPMRLSFVEAGAGRELSADEVERLYSDRGREPTAELAWEATLLDDRGPGAILEEMMRDGETWRVQVPVRRDGDAWVIDASPGVDGVPPTSVLVADPYAQLRKVAIRQSADGRVGGGVVTIETSAVLRRLRLVDAETRAPLVHARVFSFLQFGDDRAYTRGPTVLTDDSGIVELPLARMVGGARRREVPTFWVVSETHAAAIHAHRVDDAQPGMTYDVPVFRSAAVEGTARLPDGEPAVGLPVLVMQKGRPRFTYAEADGAYRIDGIAVTAATGDSERIMLIRDSETLAVTMDTAPLRAGETTQLDLGPKADEAPAATLLGTIRLGDEPAEGALLSLRGQDGERHRAIGRVGADGTYVIDGVPAGSYRFALLLGDVRVSDDASLRSTENIVLAEREERRLDFALPAGAIRVRVLDAAKRPVAGVGVFAHGNGEDTTRFAGFRYVSTTAAATDESGVALLSGLDAAQSHRVGAVSPSGAKASADEVRPGSTDAPREITLTLTSE